MRLTIVSDSDNGLKFTLGNIFNFVLRFGSAVSLQLFLGTLFSQIKGAIAQECPFNKGDLTGTTFCAQNAERTVTVAVELSPNVLPTVVNAIKNLLMKGINGVTYVTGPCNRLVYEAAITGTDSKVTSNDCYVANDIAPQIAGIFQSSATTATTSSVLTSETSTSVTSSIGQAISNGFSSLTSGSITPTSHPSSSSGMPVWLLIVCIVGGTMFIASLGYFIWYCCPATDDAPVARRRDDAARAEAGEGNSLLGDVAVANPNAEIAARIKNSYLRGEAPPVAPIPAAAVSHQAKAPVQPDVDAQQPSREEKQNNSNPLHLQRAFDIRQNVSQGRNDSSDLRLQRERASDIRRNASQGHKYPSDDVDGMVAKPAASRPLPRPPAYKPG